MSPDRALVDRVGAYRPERFEGEVFRATRVGADPTMPSASGGRWAPPSHGASAVHILYTSLERDGALAEVASFLAELTPVPGLRPIEVTRLAVSAARTIRLAHTSLPDFDVEPVLYGTRNYAQTQKIGATMAFLGFDGLIAPSARWPCDNLMIFADNHAPSERLEPVAVKEIEWKRWALEKGLLSV